MLELDNRTHFLDQQRLLLHPDYRNSKGAKSHLQQKKRIANLQQQAQLGDINNLFSEHAIDFMVLKGLALSAVLYGRPDCRQCNDIDLLVKEDQMLSAIALLHSMGFEEHYEGVETLNDAELEYYQRYKKDRILYHPKKNIVVELHWKLLIGIALADFSDVDFFQNQQAVSINGQQYKTLDNEWLLLYLCIHGVYHHFSRKQWLCDIEAMAKKNINWPRFFILAKKTKAEKAVTLAAMQANLPSCYCFSHQRYRVGFCHAVTSYLNKDSSTVAMAVVNFIWAFCVGRRWRDGWVIGGYKNASIETMQSVSLPRSLFFLYGIIRVGRLARILWNLFLDNLCKR